jgi:hypothetical protein
MYGGPISSRTVIPAEPGYYLVWPSKDEQDRTTFGQLIRRPVIAWLIEIFPGRGPKNEATIVSVTPLSIDGAYYDDPAIEFHGTVFRVDEIFPNITAYIAYIGAGATQP